MDKKQIEELAKFAGFNLVPRFGGTDTREALWQYPNGDHSRALPNFPESLDDCFKWLEPGLAYYHIDNQDKPEHWAMVSIDGIHYRDSYAETPALALCLAIEKLIDREVKK